MKAAVLFECNKPLKIINDITPPPIERGQVFVELAYSGVCHSQIMEISGGRGHDPYLPHLLGHEGSGIVREVGEDVTKVAPGDKVVLGWIKGVGIDSKLPKYKHGSLMLNAGGVTTFNSHAIVSENRCVKLPKQFPLEIAVLFGCAVPTGAGMALNEIYVSSDQTVAVYGLGGIGIIALMALKSKGCNNIIAVDIQSSKLELAKKLGAAHVINALDTDPVIEINAITSGRGVDFAIDAAGRTKTIEQAFMSLKRGGGICIFASHPPTGEKLQLDPYDFIIGKNLRGSWGGASQPDTDTKLYSEMYLSGKLPIQLLLERKYSLDNINDAIDDLASGQVMRPLIELNSSL